MYEPTNEICNGLPAYRKKGDAEIWMECIPDASEFKWYIKPVANRGPSNITSFAYCAVASEAPGLPQDCIRGGWKVGAVSEFEVQVAVQAVLTTEDALPDYIVSVLESARNDFFSEVRSYYVWCMLRLNGCAPCNADAKTTAPWVC